MPPVPPWLVGCGVGRGLGGGGTLPAAVGAGRVQAGACSPIREVAPVMGWLGRRCPPWPRPWPPQPHDHPDGADRNTYRIRLVQPG